MYVFTALGPLGQRSQCQVVSQQLHDESGILVRVLRDVVKLGNCIFESSPSHFTSVIWHLQDFVLETEKFNARPRRIGCVTARSLVATSWASSYGACILCGLRFVGSIFELGQVTMIVGLHLLVEDLGLACGGLRDQISIQQIQNGFTDLVELFLNFLAVLLGILCIILVVFGFFLLLHAGDDAPSSPAAAYCILVGHREKVALFHRKLVFCLAYLFHVLCPH